MELDIIKHLVPIKILGSQDGQIKTGNFVTTFYTLIKKSRHHLQEIQFCWYILLTSFKYPIRIQASYLEVEESQCNSQQLVRNYPVKLPWPRRWQPSIHIYQQVFLHFFFMSTVQLKPIHQRCVASEETTLLPTEICPVMRKPAFCICKNKGTNQLHGNWAADQRICYHYIVQSLFFLNPKFPASSYLQWLYNPVCVRPGWNPPPPPPPPKKVFQLRDSYIASVTLFWPTFPSTCSISVLCVFWSSNFCWSISDLNLESCNIDHQNNIERSTEIFPKNFNLSGR